jgi:hypothetical protein
MATPSQVTANQANAQKSTGPKTDAGKAKSSMNRLSYGFASNTRFIKGEDPDEFYALLNDLTIEHQPSTPTEQILVEKMAHNQWISLRASRIQGELLEALTFKELNKTLPLMIRYQTTADRAFHKAHQELLKARKQTKKSEIGFESKKAEEPAAPPQEQAPKTEPKAPFDLAGASESEIMEWLETATPEEMEACGF